MKVNKISITFTYLVAFILVITNLLSVRPISAATSPTIVLSDTSGISGTSITVSGQDFTPDYNYYIFFGQVQNFLLGRGTIDPDGTFSKSITINFTTPGDYQVTVYASALKQSNPRYDSDYDQGAVAFFTILPTPEPSIALDPSVAKQGYSIAVNGQNFTESYFYYLFFNSKYISNGIIDSNGKFNQSFVVPSVPNMGSYDVTVVANRFEDSSPSLNKAYDEEATTYITILYLIPAVTLDKNTGKVGDTFTLSGEDFSIGEAIAVYWDGTQIGSTFFPSLGNTFEDKSFSVPETYSGLHTIKIANTTQEYSLEYTVVPSITLSSNTIYSGDQIIISGTGFAALSEITFYIDDTVVNIKVTTAAKGTLGNTTFVVPDILAGSHVVKVQDNAGNSATAEINILSPQPTPSTTTAATSIPPTPSTTAATSIPSPTTITPTNVTPTPSQSSVAPTSSTPTPSTLSPTQSTVPSSTGASTQPEPTQKSTSAFPIWGIIMIAIIALIVVAGLILLIIRRRRSFYFKRGRRLF